MGHTGLIPIGQRSLMPGKIKTKQINHVTTMVKDTARAMKFYNDLLGIKQIESQVPNPELSLIHI